MRAKRGNSYNGSMYFDYEINGKYFWIQGELYYNKKKKPLRAYTHMQKGRRNSYFLD